MCQITIDNSLQYRNNFKINMNLDWCYYKLVLCLVSLVQIQNKQRLDSI